MEIPWGPLGDAPDADAQPPWVKHSRLRTQQELCARRFLRFATLRHVHGAVALWCVALWFAGVRPWLALAPIAYFSGVAAYLSGYQGLASWDVEHLSQCLLGLDALNALHLALLCGLQGERALASPAFAFVPLSRALFGFFTYEVHCHLTFSTLLAGSIVASNWARVVGNEAFLIVVAALLLELTAVVVLAEGPCGYEEALMHLSQCRAQHQLMRADALQRIDVERERFSGQLLAIATQSMSELTAAVHRASEPVLNMLKSACATGTKSARESERIGRIGESLKEEVADILRYKTQVAWTQLQGRAKARTQWLQDFSAAQREASDALLRTVQQGMGSSLAQMYEMELEAELSLEQTIHSEVNRAIETADARMDLVRHSAQAMERRVSDTVEVLLSLLKYFRAKGDDQTQVIPRALVSADKASRRCDQLAAPRPQDANGRRDRGEKPRIEVGKASKHLPAIHERAADSNQPTEDSAEVHELEEFDDGTFDESGPQAAGSGSQTPPALVEEGADDLASSSSTNCEHITDAMSATASETSPSLENGVGATVEAEVSSSECSVGEAPEPPQDGSLDAAARTLPRNREGQGSHPLGAATGRRGAMPTSAHPLFGTRLSYRTDEFFWSWASSRDLRAEVDALRAWQRASVERPAAPQVAATPSSDAPLPPPSLPTCLPPAPEPRDPEADVMPEHVYADLSDLPAGALRRESSRTGTSSSAGSRPRWADEADGSDDNSEWSQ